MSVDDCISTYTQLSSRVFQKKHASPVKISGKVQARYSSEELQRAIEDVVEKSHMDRNALLKDTSPQACKVFVAGQRAMRVNSTADYLQVRLRNEQGRRPPFHTTELSTDPRNRRPLP